MKVPTTGDSSPQQHVRSSSQIHMCPPRRQPVARIQLDNQLGVPLYRTIFTGTDYTVEPPEMIPPNALVFWQTNNTGPVTHSLPRPGNRATAPPAANALP